MYVSRIPKHMDLQFAKLMHSRKIDTCLNIYYLLNLLLFINAKIGSGAIMSQDKEYMNGVTIKTKEQLRCQVIIHTCDSPTVKKSSVIAPPRQYTNKVNVVSRRTQR